MIDRLVGKKVVGFKQSFKAIKSGKAKTVYVAKDSDDKIHKQVEEAAQENSFDIVYIGTMKELGKLCGIDVGAAIAVLINE
ncbi:ribosomal L7Ae/L30e/S12e/Gadd45 family protein [Clostridium rectalis]|uniref:ribosomal L7Ae/L30e/S12e/Gadd45 family protein n=1 Tax=Clostridium rectalis TaxID=2040295 RepID=UPI000F63750F|nr:ribosomal L7Ae/L30e/S12e/Gadd45 family protein [Clostridium rectalis]